MGYQEGAAGLIYVLVARRSPIANPGSGTVLFRANGATMESGAGRRTRVMLLVFLPIDIYSSRQEIVKRATENRGDARKKVLADGL